MMPQIPAGTSSGKYMPPHPAITPTPPDVASAIALTLPLIIGSSSFT